jgi:diguanylate cyclase (GGDEF)-like protein
VRADHRDGRSGAALVAVPDYGLARSLGRVLEQLGLVCLMPSDGDPAELAAREKALLAIVDLDPGGFGLEVCASLRELPATARIPILALTSTLELPRHARSAGITDFVTKPVDRETLAARIAFHLAPAPPSAQSDASAAEIRSRLRRLESSQAFAGIGYWEWDAQTHEVRLGPGTAAVLRLRDPLPTQLDDLLEACVHPEDRERLLLGLQDAVAGERVPDGLLSRHPDPDDGRFFKHFPSVSRGSAISPTLVTVTVLDVTHERRAEESARRIAFYDGLTGLPNRRLFERRLVSAMRRSRDDGNGLALLFLDLDGFKQVNDRLGHGAGDELLRAIGQRLLESVRGGDDVTRLRGVQSSVSRFGGDEFAVLLTGLREAEDAAECARRIHARLSAPIELASGEARVGVSVGIALYPRDGETSSALLSAADAAMYAAKSERTQIYCFYRADLHATTTRIRLIAEQLGGAAARGELSIAWQPKFDLTNGHIAGAEALLRWTNPLLGAVSPSEFVPIAEDTGLILEVGRWVLEAACKEAAHWMRELLEPPTLAVNVSRVQLVAGNLERVVYDALMQSALDPHLLQLEITESLMIEGENALAPLRDLSAIGLTLAHDDFGSGYSTLASLVRFPVQTLKLDRALIRDIDSNPDAARVVRAVIRMAHELGRRVVAEGVDNHAALRVLREAECDEAQGFLLAKPMPAGEFRRLLESWRPAEALARWRA